jgi:molybdate transport system substrate-binding protein
MAYGLRNSSFTLQAVFVALSIIALPAVSHAESVTVFAAASMNNALTDIAKLYQSSHPNDEIKTSFAASSLLAKQIQAGAPAQIFVSADQPWMDALAKDNLLLTNSRVDLLANTLVLITPADAPFPVIMQKDFHLPRAFGGKICLANPDSVPAGKYGKQALTTEGWWEELQPRVVPTEDVRSALAFVARGECAAGVVYSTDAKISDKVKIIGTFPADSHAPIVYPMALVKTSNDQTQATPAAKAFWQYLQQPAAQTIFAKYGFGAVKAATKPK